MTTARARAEAQNQRFQLTRSYNELLEAFSSKDLQKVGNYELGRLIGKGSFGKVYLATHKLTNGSKVVLKSANKNDSNLAREIHHHRQFLHPHIARLYEVIITETLVWLVLEYCPGDELYNYLHNHGALAVEKVQRIFTQLVGAVMYVHMKSCVHRDLKLENILLDKHENVKLCDFGFTREYEGKASYLQTSCGTVCYAAPEMLKGEKYAGEKVDVWSLGVILYALLTGELPFDEDDDNATKAKILTTEPKYPDHLPPDAKALIQALLSKRSLLRPPLADILANPFLSEHAPQQQAVLKIQHPPPFSTNLEQETLQRMHSAGIDIDKVVENVLAHRCDSLAGWWALLIEKEQRKEARRESKRRQKESETRTLRRLSATSARLDRSAASGLRNISEESSQSPGDAARGRARREARKSLSPPEPTELPRLLEMASIGSLESPPPPRPVDKDSIRSNSSSRQHRQPPPPPPPPKEPGRRSRNSTLQMATSNPDPLSPTTIRKRRRSRWQKHPILAQLSHMRQWLAKRARSPGSKASPAPGNSPGQQGASTPDLASQPPRSTLTVAMIPASKASSAAAAAPTAHTPTSMRRRSSLSPAPITPHSSFRRASAGLRGRKSTSSSVSSVRSVHHRHSHSHSKASSTSSNSFTLSSVPKTARSPRTSVKVLPTTPTTVTFPSNIRVVRAPPNNYNETAAAFAPHSPGLNFARRKRRAAKGPLLSVGTGVNGPTRRDSTASRTASQAGRRSGEIIEEEDEEDIEEVDAFSPVVGPGEVEVSIVGPACFDDGGGGGGGGGGGSEGETRNPVLGSAVTSADLASS